MSLKKDFIELSRFFSIVWFYCHSIDW
jgi:hypothetical protein